VVETTGDFVVPDLPTPGRYHVRVEGTDFDLQEFDVEIGAGETVTVDTAQLSAADGRIAGIVTDASGAPVGGVLVEVRGPGIDRSITTPTTGSGIGGFTLADLPTPGTYVLRFSTGGTAPTTLALELSPGATREGLVVTLAGGTGSVSGTVTDGAGAPLGGVTVTVARGAVVRTTTSLAGAEGSEGVGTWTLGDLVTPARYTVTFAADGYTSETRTVLLDGAGPRAGVDAVMHPSTGSIVGRITVAGNARAGIDVIVSDGATETAVQTAADGSYAVTGLDPGSYAVTITSAGLQPRVVVIEVAAGAPTPRDVDVVPVR
jgi:hypothetical protein